MIRIRDTLDHDPITINGVQSRADLQEAAQLIREHGWLALDTESTGLNCYRPDWRLKLFQVGDAFTAYVVPARYRGFISWAMKSDTEWIGHNGAHDIRCVDAHLGCDTGVVCKGETYIACHNQDSRNRAEGGKGHGLKDQSVAFIDRNADKWEKKLKEEFKKISVPIPGEVYKSGPRKGTQKMRKIKYSEGWEAIDPNNRPYIAYAGADPILTFRRWAQLSGYVKSIMPLYAFDHAVDHVCDILQRRAIPVDVPYTERLSAAYLRKANRLQRKIDTFAERGVNINSTDQLADVLLDLDVELTELTDTGKWRVNGDVLRAVRDDPYVNQKAKQFIRLVLLAKQITKRRSAYTEAMLRERDVNDRLHASINSQAARTFRMSVSNPGLQQLPTKDHEDEEDWEEEELA